MSFNKKEEIVILKSLHKILSSVDKEKIANLDIYWSLLDAIKVRGGEFK